MCGLIGFVGKGDAFNLSAGAACIRRRGPDGLGEWRSDDGRVQVVHALLSISEEAISGKQPMVDAEAGLVIAFNGEIYNHKDLRAGIQRTCSTASDTETILKLFGEQGLSALADLRGMFAIVLVDNRNRSVVLMRDPIGKKPLFVLERPEGAYFGSSVVALAQASGHAQLDPAVAKMWWSLDYPPPDRSVLTGCTPLLPGEVVRLSWDGHIVSRTHIAPPQPQPIARIDFGDAVDELELRVRTAVKRRLADNPKPVALLSGGIDSTVVSKFALESGAVRLMTFEPRLFWSADSEYAREAAKRLGAPLDIIPVKLKSVRTAVEQALALQDEPLAMISFVPLALMSGFCAAESRVLLTGDGGDEALCGYGRPGDWIGEHRIDGENFASGPTPPAWMSAYAHRAIGHDLVGHGLAKLDRATAEQALEARSPLLDWDVLSLVRSLPSTIVLPGDTAKPMAKALLRGWPRPFLERHKVGFSFRLRALWGLSFYSGLRERISPEAMDLFRPHLPSSLRNDPMHWSTIEIGRNFASVYRLFVWSLFLARMQSPSVARGGPRSLRAG